MKSGRNALLVLVLLLSFIGLADSWYLAQSAIEGSELSCSIGAGLDGCNVVAESEYSRVLGIPLALYGVGFYGLAFVAGALLFVRRERFLYQALLALGGFGFVASLYFLFLQLFIIKATCIYCLVSLVVATILCFVAYRLFKRHAPARLAVVA